MKKIFNVFCLIFHIIDQILDEAVKKNRNKLGIAPIVLGAIISGAVTIGSKIAADIKAGNAAKKLDAERAVAKAEVKAESEKQLTVARGIARQGDPLQAQRKREITKGAADVVGKAVATSGSTQEIIKAAQGAEELKQKALVESAGRASQFKFGATKFLAARFGEAGRQRIAGQAAIDIQAQQALDAISQGAQATTDTAQNLGSQLIQALGTAKLAEG